MADLDQYMSAIVAGDARAFGRWVTGAESPLRDSLRAFATVLDAEAVLQESLLRVWQVAPRFVPDGRPNALLRLALRITRNLAISEVRRTRARPMDDDDLERRLTLAESGVASGEPDPMLRARIDECREQLPDKPAQALTERLRTAGGEPDEVLAERLGMRPNTFLQNFTRARRLLAECLEAQGVDLATELR